MVPKSLWDMDNCIKLKGSGGVRKNGNTEDDRRGKTMKKFMEQIGILLLLIVLFTVDSVYANEIQEFDQKRNQLIGYALYKALPAFHFSHEEMDDSLSRKVFSLYLKQLDYQKRFLLESDVEKLRAFEPSMIGNLARGATVLPKAGYDIMRQRIAQVEKMVDQIMSTGFDVQREDIYETDPDKVVYAADLEELQDRWRRIMKARVLHNYFEVAGGTAKTGVNVPDDELWQQAEEKVAKTNTDFLHRMTQETLQNHYDRYFNALAEAYDPHTEYFPPLKREEFEIQLTGNVEGVGATLRDENGFNKVVSIIPGGPAAKQGLLQPEDIILQLEEKGGAPVDITDMRPRDAARLIRGAKGTEVVLTVKKPDGSKKVIPLVRDVVQIEESFVKDTLLESPDGRKIGYIQIPGFYRDFEKTSRGENGRNVTDDTRKALKNMAKVEPDGIILDLRNDVGGSLIDAVNIAGMFIGSGPVVQIKTSNGEVQVLNDTDPDIEYGGSLVVLVDTFSASASEIVAAALQDYKRAIIVGGKQTYGKGTVQNNIPLNKYLRAAGTEKFGDLGVVKVTTKKFYRITGDSTQYKGLEPDIVLSSTFQQQRSGEKYLDNALPWDEIEPASYSLFEGKPFDLGMIVEASQQRTETSPRLHAIAREAKNAEERSRQTADSLAFAAVSQQLSEIAADQSIPSIHVESQQDPYVEEALNIIDDMSKQS